MLGRSFFKSITCLNRRNYSAGREGSIIFPLIGLSFSSLCLGVVSYLQNKEIDELKGRVKSLEESKNRGVHWFDIKLLDDRVRNLENKENNERRRGC